MCDFPSWKQKGNQVLFLTDKEAHEISSNVYDVVGHSAIEKYFGLAEDGWVDHELSDPVPEQFVKAIRENRCQWMMAANNYKQLHFDDRGLLHRTDGPAVEYDDGSKEWYVNGQYHRTDGPAIERADGSKCWYVNGRIHRTDGPAIEYADGTKEWWVGGRIHRDGGPAVEQDGGTKKWWVNGLLHRDDGPAVEYADGTKEWFQRGIRHRDDDGPLIEWPSDTKK